LEATGRGSSLFAQAAQCDGGDMGGTGAEAVRRGPHIGVRPERRPMGAWRRGPRRFEAVLYDATGHGWVLVHPDDRARRSVVSYDRYSAEAVARAATADLDRLPSLDYAKTWCVPPEVIRD